MYEEIDRSGSPAPARVSEPKRGKGVRRINDPEEQRRVQDMLAEGGGVARPRVLESDVLGRDILGEDVLKEDLLSDAVDLDVGAPSSRFEARSQAEVPSARLLAWLEEKSKSWGKDHLKTLVKRKGRLARSMDRVPQEMHLVANQTELILELLDDFRLGHYSEISWRSVALVTFGLLYAISPADVIPDVLPIVGRLDDLTVLAVVTRAINSDLRAYCRFKGYPESKYFRDK